MPSTICLPRYRAVMKPMKPRLTTRQTGIIIATIWMISLALVLPYVLVLRVTNNNCIEVWPSVTIRKIYTIGLFVFQYALPLTIIAIAYTRVVFRLRMQAKRMAKNFEIMMKAPSPPLVEENCKNVNLLASEPNDNASSASPLPERKISLNGNKDTQMCDKTLLNSPNPGKMLFRSDIKDDKHYTERNYLVPMDDEQSSTSPLASRKSPSNKNKRKQHYLRYNSIVRQNEARRLEHNKKIVNMLLLVVLLYAICLLPNQVVWLWYEFGSGHTWAHINELLIFGSIMVYVNSSVNPLLYAGMNEEFRKGFARILRCKWRERQPELV